ncbi:MAG: hypothetical protein O2780_04860 [Proteobacteria bacterium]|nr:hypothetical protein [Pseudomonadota bacterium]MDA1300076.1 hypothetical protein [Pseudomonadota bacterium]
MSQERFDPEKLSAEEIKELVHSEHTTTDQLNLLAARTQHLNRQRRQELAELDELMARIEQRIEALTRQ